MVPSIHLSRRVIPQMLMLSAHVFFKAPWMHHHVLFTGYCNYGTQATAKKVEGVRKSIQREKVPKRKPLNRPSFISKDRKIIYAGFHAPSSGEPGYKKWEEEILEVIERNIILRRKEKKEIVRIISQ